MRILLAFCFCLTTVSLLAQEGEAEGPAYVQGPVYKVINRAEGPVILWEGKPAASYQVVNSAPDLLTVYPPNSVDARLLIYLRPDGRMKEVIDLEYQQDPRKTTTPVTAASYLAAGPIKVTFRNGLVFVYEDGKATALYEDEFLPVIGEKGRYRIKTDLFEAGVSFEPYSGTKVYRYLKEL